MLRCISVDTSGGSYLMMPSRRSKTVWSNSLKHPNHREHRSKKGRKPKVDKRIRKMILDNRYKGSDLIIQKAKEAIQEHANFLSKSTRQKDNGNDAKK